MKYGNVKTVYNGRRFDSKLEAGYAMGLDVRVKAGEVAAWRPQVRIPLMVNGTKVADYVVDFEVTHTDGAVDLVEVKGAETDAWKLKRNMLLAGYLADHPAIGYYVVYKERVVTYRRSRSNWAA